MDTEVGFSRCAPLVNVSSVSGYVSGSGHALVVSSGCNSLGKLSQGPFGQIPVIRMIWALKGKTYDIKERVTHVSMVGSHQISHIPCLCTQLVNALVHLIGPFLSLERS